MSRPLRIEYPEAWYHVMNHGRRSENVFLKKRDYHTFIELLKEASELWTVAIAAFCLMPNHYHLLIRTPQGNLSRFMRHVNGVYTQRFNKNNNYEGQLFKGRFKSILVYGDSYLLQLLRYIHRNPIRAKLVKRKKGRSFEVLIFVHPFFLLLKYNQFLNFKTLHLNFKGYVKE